MKCNPDNRFLRKFISMLSVKKNTQYESELDFNIKDIISMLNSGVNVIDPLMIQLVNRDFSVDATQI